MLNLAENLQRSAKQYPEKTVISFADKHFTYQQLDVISNQVAHALIASGIEPGDKVALSCPNLPYFPMVYYGILKAGATVVPLNVLLKPREIAYHLADSETKAYFCFEGTDELPMGQMGYDAFTQVKSCDLMFLITADPAAAPAIDGITTFGQLIHGQPTDAILAQTDEADTAVILYTSGTTGQPKGAELTHYNMSMNAYSSNVLMRETETDIQLITLPLFHSFGQTVQMNAVIAAGASMILLARFEPGAVFKAMQAHAVTIFAGVPTMYIGLLNFPQSTDYDLDTIVKNLRLAISGGSSMPVEVMRQFEEKYQVPILEGYGLSETCPVATFNHLDKPRLPGSVGQIIEGCEVKVVDSDGNEVAAGEIGEVVLKGHNVMKGYFKRPSDTEQSIVDGWFHTGDLGRKDDAGNLYIVDRLKEMIIRGGFNVYPREIEEVLMTHPHIEMVAVLGIPHATHGEEIKAYVVSRNGYNNADELRAWSKERLADYKYPREFEFRKALPMNATGKLLKRELKAEVAC